MKRLALFLIGIATPRVDREWVIGDTIEEFAQLERLRGKAAAWRWLGGELCRVLLHAPRHRLTVRQSTEVADGNGDGAMSSIWQDVRYAFRLLRQSPGFAAIAVTTLALGIGVNSAMFAAVNGVLLKPLPFKKADQLMFVHLLLPHGGNAGGSREMVWSYPKYQVFLTGQQSFEDAALFRAHTFSLTGGGEPERVRGEIVTEHYPAVLGLNLPLGRAFTRAEAEGQGAAPVVIISHGLWTRRFGADPGILGRTIHLGGTAYTVVGVLPPSFHGLSGTAQLLVPLGTFEPSQLRQLQSHAYYLVARRKAAVSEEQAIADVRILGGQIDTVGRSGTRGSPLGAGAWGATAASLYQSRVDTDIRRASLIVLGAVGFVLLIACVNLTNLMGTRAVARGREVAVRLAIGAGRARVARQLAVEGVVLAIFGAVAGLLVAFALLSAATSLLPNSDVFFRSAMAPGVPRTAGAAGLTRIGAAMVAVDAPTVLFTLSIALVAGLLVSIVPVLHASSLRPADALRASRGASTGRGGHAITARAMLEILQVALALILLAGAGLLVKSGLHLYGTSIGVKPERVLTIGLALPESRYTAETGATFFTHLTEQLRAIPGVESVGLGHCRPLSGGCNATTIEFPPSGALGKGKDPFVGVNWSSPDYLSTLGIEVLRGRNFTEQDRAGRPKVVLVNEAAARAFWPNDMPLGKRVVVNQGGFSDGAEVVGIVSNVRYRAIESVATPDVYIPLAQSFQSTVHVFIRSQIDAQHLVPLVRHQVRTLDSTLPLGEIKTMDESVADALWRTRVGAWLLSAFAALALLLTAVGIFGVMAQTVVQRTAEIGIRMALGAQRKDVLALVIRRAALMTGAGLVFGVGGALGLTRFMAGMLYQVEANDPVTFVSVAAVLGLVALIAGYIPARRATRVDAVVALRAE